MAYIRVDIDCRKITDWHSFFSLFADQLGFPAFFDPSRGRMDGWIDCLSSVDAPEDALTTIHAPPGGVMVLRLDHVREFAARCPEIYAALIECSAFVNWRRMEIGEPPVLVLSFSQ